MVIIILLEVVLPRYSAEKLFLKISQENTYAEISFSIKLETEKFLKLHKNTCAGFSFLIKLEAGAKVST